MIKKTADKFWSEKITWAFGSGELKIASLQSDCVVDISCGLKFDIHTKGIKKYTSTFICTWDD